MLEGYGTPGFWNGVVLQASHANEAVKHLVIAVSNIYYWEFPKLQSKDVVFLSHYLRALKVLQSARQDAVMTVIASILLALCEELQNRPSSAMLHIQAGQRILGSQTDSSLQRWTSTPVIAEIRSTLSCFVQPRFLLKAL